MCVGVEVGGRGSASSGERSVGMWIRDQGTVIWRSGCGVSIGHNQRE